MSIRVLVADDQEMGVVGFGSCGPVRDPPEGLDGTDPRVSAFIEDDLIQGGRYSNLPREEALASGAKTPAELDRRTERPPAAPAAPARSTPARP